jgi:hypothetical protein
MTIASPDLAASNRAKGAELIVALGSLKRPDEALQAEWEAVVGAFPEVTFGEPVVTTIGGEEAYRAVFTDPGMVPTAGSSYSDTADSCTSLWHKPFRLMLGSTMKTSSAQCCTRFGLSSRDRLGKSSRPPMSCEPFG